MDDKQAHVRYFMTNTLRIAYRTEVSIYLYLVITIYANLFIQQHKRFKLCIFNYEVFCSKYSFMLLNKLLLHARDSLRYFHYSF